MPSEDSKLRRLLQEQQDSYIDDAGFTRRVLQALPPRPFLSPELRRLLLIGSAALLAFLAAFFALLPYLETLEFSTELLSSDLPRKILALSANPHFVWFYLFALSPLLLWATRRHAR